MADEADDDSKTEEASERKIQDALDKGNVPFSRETVMFASLVAILAALGLFASDVVSRLTMVLMKPLDHSGAIQLRTSEDAHAYLGALFNEALLAIAPISFLLSGMAILAALGQNVPRVVFHRIKPDPSRLSIAKGWKRIFGMQGLVEFGKSLFKFCAIGCVGGLALHGIRSDITNALLMDPVGLPSAALSVVLTIGGTLALAAVALAIADFSWSRFHWRRQLRMTPDELKREHKQSEGDPVIKAHIRSLARQRSRRRMMAQVPLATLVLANPTHYSVALRYEPGRDAAPVVLAKGQDLIALRIREVAEASGVPVIEDKLLARGLYKAVEVDQMIPPEFYRAVAEVVLFLNAKRLIR
jgi:flagellar biosynthesis protein FlhB